jgi:hypothetical protein
VAGSILILAASSGSGTAFAQTTMLNIYQCLNNKEGVEG